jgi:hypothetical protein
MDLRPLLPKKGFWWRTFRKRPCIRPENACFSETHPKSHQQSIIPCKIGIPLPMWTSQFAHSGQTAH